MQRRILSLLLVLTLIAGMLPAPAFAEETEPTVSTEPEMEVPTAPETPTEPFEDPTAGSDFGETVPEETFPEGTDPPEEYPVSGSCGESLSWTLTEEGVLTLSGSGDMDTYSSTEPAPWAAYAGEIVAT